MLLAWAAAFIIVCGLAFHWVIYRTHLAKKQPARISPQADYLYLRFVVELLDLVVRLAGQVDTELAVDIRVDLGENDGGMCLAAAQK